MAWTVILENENRESLEAISGEFSSDSIINGIMRSDFKLLKYLNPYGDTFFNTLQAEDLIFDLEKLKELDKTNTLIDEVILLAKRCKNLPHAYLGFYGD